MERQLRRLKTLVGITTKEKDDLLTLILEMATTNFLSYTNRTEVPQGAENTVLDLAVARYNRMGVEGLEKTSYSNISETYTQAFSESEKESLNRWRKVKLL